ncbi:MAG: GTP-binding protein [Pseudomonadota bacterium]
MSQDLLCFSTAGSVDDGKSTLIGRLLYDTGNILEDQYQALAEASGRRGKTEVDLALLTDGLQAEREQGITIDVAYRYFSTEKRKFIIVDSPGHEQYTRNMVTGATHAQAAIILVDARLGIQKQTRRHSYIARMLGIPHLIFAINKMDLIQYDQAVFNDIKEELIAWVNQRDDHFGEPADIQFIPVSALNGDNIVHRSTHMNWYKGDTLLEYLQKVPVATELRQFSARFPIQGVSRPSAHDGDDLHDFRGYTGLLETGALRVGDKVNVLPAGHTSVIDRIYTLDGWLDEAHAGESITVLLKDDIDISRGDTLVRVEDTQAPQLGKLITADICWLSDRALDPRRKYLLKHTTRTTKVMIDELINTVDIHTLETLGAKTETLLNGNDIGRVRLKLQQPIVADRYAECRPTGSFILIDESTLNTVGAGLIREIQ